MTVNFDLFHALVGCLVMANFPSDTAAQISMVQTEIAMSPGLPNVYFNRLL